MRALADACRRAEEDLSRLEEKIGAVEADLASFENHAFVWPDKQIALRLQYLSNAIEREASRLMAEHGGLGCVAVWIGRDGIDHIAWLESPELLDGKEYCNLGNSKLVLVNILVRFIIGLLMELRKGNWTMVVSWLNHHAIYSEKWQRLS